MKQVNSEIGKKVLTDGLDQVKFVSIFKLHRTGYFMKELEFLRFLLTGKEYFCQQIICRILKEFMSESKK